jgi:hypothetical protein
MTGREMLRQFMDQCPNQQTIEQNVRRLKLPPDNGSTKPIKTDDVADAASRLTRALHNHGVYH